MNAGGIAIVSPETGGLQITASATTGYDIYYPFEASHQYTSQVPQNAEGENIEISIDAEVPCSLTEDMTYGLDFGRRRNLQEETLSGSINVADWTPTE